MIAEDYDATAIEDEAWERNVQCASLCIYYAGCDAPRNDCGYCDNHCLCGAPRTRTASAR